MTDHLRYSGLPFGVQRSALEAIIRANPVLMDVLEGLRATGLLDCWLVSGAIYNEVWNSLTGRPALTGVKDVDIAYFDASDLSYEAEDRVIRQFETLFSHLPVPIEPRNQARVHLWFPERFGQPYAPLKRTVDMLVRFASRTHAVAARLEPDGSMAIEAPFGLDPIFSFRIEPNHVLDNRAAHESKAARAKAVWPELTVVPW